MKNNSMPKAPGVSMLEVMIIVVVLAILVSFAAPGYFKTLEKSRSAEPQAVLPLIYREIKAASEDGVTLPANFTPCDASWANLNIDDPNLSARAWFSYWIDTSTSTAVARRRNNPRAACSANVNAARFLQIDLLTGNITKSPEYQ
ncbi:MAG: hypothetical protein COV72_07435 [Candidatus Omnitrophica bacterium CG11_big_fil_rev_8_21_14_0_20_42_13]|uniref:Prepilin-type N-terminal cleavage/methylation domain-containing protein n=1 Tax=Candidatus Ghiorseimicrobium undicola TaxID=1974746 RepID=A0A2H0LW00_9BACT|nr:MAG: hypothetical protein COV72_07435 [Candidatus Omnitrophica bacterium CG11_big_fil_rev_8_21_14_0_20_42_13]